MKNISIRRWELYIIITVLVIMATLLQKMFVIMLLTFIFSYLSSSILTLLKKTKLHIIPHKIQTFFLYILFIFLFTSFCFLIIPSAYRDTITIFKSVPESFNVNDFIKNDIIKNMPLTNQIDEQSITQFLHAQDISKISFGDITAKVTTVFGIISTVLIEIFISFILSFFIVFEQEELVQFFKNIEKGPIGRHYLWLKPFFSVLVHSFGKTFESQTLIALINSVLTIIGLYFFGFNYLLALWFIVFIFSFVPVFGMIVSTIPLVIIGFVKGGMMMVINVIILVALVHFLEAYFLNPHIYASKAKLPTTIAFVALVVGEFVAGVWGLLLAIPTLYFLYNIFVLEKVKWHVE